MHRKSIVTKALALAVIISIQGCEKKTAQIGPQAPPEVLVTQVITADVPVIREWVGTLDGSENADIRARVTGYLQKRDYQEGSYVKEGDLLFEIDPRPFEAALEQAKSELGQVQATQAASQADFERSQELYNRKVISVQEYENKRQLNQAQVAKTQALEAADLVNRRRADAEVPLQVSFGGRPSEHVRVSVDESQILSLLGRKVWRSRPR